MTEVEDKSDSTYLGQIGEDFFSKLCWRAKLTPQKPTSDLHGWDFYVEFPLEIDDKNELQKRLKVQVKSTNNIKREWQIKLSNLYKFVGDPLPALICFPEFDNKDDPVRGYLVHIDNKLSENIIKKVTKLKFDGETELHNHTYTIKYGDTDKIEPLDSKTLKDKMLSFIPDGFDNYVQNKIIFIKNAGYKHSPLEGKMILSFNASELIDLNFGVKKGIKVLEAQLFKSRFGMVQSKPFKIIKDGILTIEDKQTETINIDFKNNYYGIALSFEANLYLLPLILADIISEKEYKFKVVSSFFEFIAHPYDNKGNLTFNLNANDEIVKITEFKKASKLFALLKNSHKKNVYLQLTSKNIGDFGCQLEYNNEFINEFSNICMTIDAAYEIATRYEHQDIIETSFDDLIESEDYTLAFYNICLNSENELFVRFKNEVNNKIIKGKEYGVIANPFITKIGKYYYICIVAIILKLKKVLKEYIIMTGRSKYHKFIIIKDSDEKSKITFKNEINEITQEMSRDSIINLVKDNNHINSFEIKWNNLKYK